MWVKKQQLEPCMEQTDWFKKGVQQGCLWAPCLFNLYVEYIKRNARLDELVISWNPDRWEKHQQPQICR